MTADPLKAGQYVILDKSGQIPLFLLPASVTSVLGWFNAVTGEGADPTGTSDSTAAIQAAISSVPSSGGTVYLPAGTYKLTGALTARSGLEIRGDGRTATVLNQTSTTATAISGTDVANVRVSGLTISGPGSGSGNGISLVPSASSNIEGIVLDDLLVENFGNTGVHLDTPIVSTLTSVISTGHGGDGFQFSNAKSTPTSLSLNGCYASNNGFAGYEFDSAAYCSLNGCASDHNEVGYALYSCQGVTLSGCGAEWFTTNGYVFDGCTGCALFGARTYKGGGVAIYVTDGTTRQTIGGATETSPNSATNFIKTDAGTSSVIWGVTNVTADSLASDTTTVLDGSA